MRRILIALILILMASTSTIASQLPEELKSFVEKEFPKTNFRFDGVVILPDTTVYLPLYPSKPVDVEQLNIKRTFPENGKMAQKPDIIIFNNDIVLMKVINKSDGSRTIFVPATIPAEITTGLLPQDMLVPRGLVIPENLKGIIGNLNIKLAENKGLKIAVPTIKNGASDSVSPIQQLKNKTFYIATGYSKDIQVINSENKSPVYALSQNYVPNDMKAIGNEFLLVTSYSSPTINIISLQDEDVIKQIHLATIPDEILLDKVNNIAYISSSEGESLYVVNLENMTLKKQIKINGMCEKFTLSDDGTKIFYFDKKTHEIWAIELDNNYLLKNIGRFPNVSKITFANNKIYIASRTKNRLAIVDYQTNGLIAEVEICEKPVDMIAYDKNLFVLGANENIVQVINTETDKLTDSIYLNTNGFSTNMDVIENTNLAIISDTRASMYCILDLSSKRIVKVSPIDVPIRTIVITEKVKKLNK